MVADPCGTVAIDVQSTPPSGRSNLHLRPILGRFFLLTDAKLKM
jgi:hypothetical protein